MPNKSLEPTPVTKARFVSVSSGAAQLNRYVSKEESKVNMQKIALSVLALQICWSNTAQANASGNGTVTYIGGQFTIPSLPASIYFGISPAPVNRAACNNNDTFQFVFDPNTTEGKALYAALLAAQASGRQIHVYGTGTCILGQPMEGVVFWNVAP